MSPEFIPLIQLVGLFAGWFVVHQLTIRRDSKKARKEMVVKTVDTFIADVADLYKKSFTYHTKVREILVEIEIKMASQDISARVLLLAEISDDANELELCRAAIINMKKSIAGSHFEDEHQGALDQMAPQLQSITSAIQHVKLCFTRLKQKQFSVRSKALS